MFAQLGDIRFEGILSPESTELGKSASYAEHPLIGGKPLLQRTGTGLDELKLTMRLHAMFCTPEDEVRKLNGHLSSGTALKYVTGGGQFIGTFVIVETRQAFLHQGPGGRIIETTIEATLREAGAADSSGVSAVAAGFAQAINSPAISVEQITPISPTLIASQSVTGALANNTSAGNSVAQAANNPAKQQSELKKAAENARRMKNDVQSAITKVNETAGTVYNQTRALEAELQSSISLIESFRSASQANNLLEALAAFDALQPTVFNIRRESEVLASYKSVRFNG